LGIASLGACRLTGDGALLVELLQNILQLISIDRISILPLFSIDFCT
jgi:hypothetical protein